MDRRYHYTVKHTGIGAGHAESVPRGDPYSILGLGAQHRFRIRLSLRRTLLAVYAGDSGHRTPSHPLRQLLSLTQRFEAPILQYFASFHGFDVRRSPLGKPTLNVGILGTNRAEFIFAYQLLAAP